MTTTEEILAGLHAERAALEDGRDLVGVHRVDGQVIAHQALHRLRSQRAAHADLAAAAEQGADAALAAAHRDACGQLDSQIGYWRRQVDVDADPAPAGEVAAIAPAARPRVRRRSV